MESTKYGADVEKALINETVEQSVFQLQALCVKTLAELAVLSSRQPPFIGLVLQ
jgi:hypothetical protein